MGRQFADDSMTPSPISVSRNQYQDEIPTDKPMHEDTTPGHSNPMYTGRQYADDVKYSSKGTKGPEASKEQTTINPHAAERGAES